MTIKMRCINVTVDDDYVEDAIDGLTLGKVYDLIGFEYVNGETWPILINDYGDRVAGWQFRRFVQYMGN